MSRDFFNASSILSVNNYDYTIFHLEKLENAGLCHLDRLPISIRIMLESILRQCYKQEITQQDVINLAGWKPHSAERPNLPFHPARVIMQDFTGVPAIVDLAAMRNAVSQLGGDPKRINPLVPVDLVIDHSVQVDFFAHPDALQRNSELEFQRNKERYEFLHWGQKAFSNFRVVPPATGIVHQVNLEFLAQVVMKKIDGNKVIAIPDTLVGTDSHTTMINGLGVVGWGVGGIEAEAAMLGLPIDMVTPDVIGFKLYGQLSEGVTATDLVLTITQLLRKKGVVEKFVEFYGEGISSLTLPDRATIANMAPEYGATIGFFPVDDETLRYLRLTGRPTDLVDLVEHYTKEQNLFHYQGFPDPEFSDTLELDLSRVEPSIAGPKRPQDRIALSLQKISFSKSLRTPVTEGGYGLNTQQILEISTMGTNGGSLELKHGSIVIAAITSCTNTSNPSVMVAAGLLAKKAVERGLKVVPSVKTSLAPGSRVVTEYLVRAGLLEPLAELGFNVVGYGCTTCIGNSGPLPNEVVKAISKANLIAAAVLSGNRNFEGRVHPYVRANYLVSPPLVVAFALAGTVDIDLVNEPLGLDKHGTPVYLRDIWPSQQEVNQLISQIISPQMFTSKYANVFTGNETWNSITSEDKNIYPWNPDSTYIQEPPFFIGLTSELQPLQDIIGARVIVLLGDSITTDHISPAGAIPAESPAGKFLLDHGVQLRDFNSYGARRGNDKVMTRGTFANIRLRNHLIPDVEGGVTIHFPTSTQMSIFDAAMLYQKEKIPLIVLAGKEYGSGSSRDWAAKGTLLLGINAVLAESYERIHRSNLIGMGVLPLQFLPGENIETLGLTGSEIFDINNLNNELAPGSIVTITAKPMQKDPMQFKALVRLDTAIELDYYRNGGILQYVIRKFISE